MFTGHPHGGLAPENGSSPILTAKDPLGRLGSSKQHSAAKPQPNPRASRLTAEDAKALAKAAKEPGSLRPFATTSAPFA